MALLEIKIFVDDTLLQTGADREAASKLLSKAAADAALVITRQRPPESAK